MDAASQDSLRHGKMRWLPEMLVLSRFMVLSLINALRLDSKTESESTNRTDIGNPPRVCTAYHTSRSRLTGDRRQRAPKLPPSTWNLKRHGLHMTGDTLVDG